MQKIPFDIPVVDDNKVGWGPTRVPEKYRKLHSQTFNKDDKLSSVIDFTQFMSSSNKRGSMLEAIEDRTFTVVDKSKPVAARKSKIIKQKPTRSYNTGYYAASGGQNQGRDGMRTKKTGNWRGHNRQNIQDASRTPSIAVKKNWKVISSTEFGDLPKLSVSAAPVPSDVFTCGVSCEANPIADNNSFKSSVLLPKSADVKDFSRSPVDSDPLMQRIASEPDAPNVFVTDTALIQIMLAAKSSSSWDIEFIKTGNRVKVTHRENAFDLLTVNESMQDQNAEDEVRSSSLKLWRNEATDVNRDFKCFLLSGRTTALEMPDTFRNQAPQVMNRQWVYRSYNLHNRTILVRTSIDGWQMRNGEQKRFCAFALNEWNFPNSGSADKGWRARIEKSGTSTIFTDELKSNHFRIARWIAQSHLAGADMIKFGFVTRKDPKDIASGHVLLGVETHLMQTIMMQLHINERNMWGVFEHFLKQVEDGPDGKYVLMKDPNRNFMRLYHIPMDAELSTVPSSDSDVETSSYEYDSDYESESEPEDDK